jgi:hypothetical protein
VSRKSLCVKRLGPKPQVLLEGDRIFIEEDQLWVAMPLKDILGPWPLPGHLCSGVTFPEATGQLIMAETSKTVSQNKPFLS